MGRGPDGIREEVGKRLKDEMTGDKRGLTSPRMLQLQTPVHYQQTREGVGKRLEDEMTGYKSGLTSPRMLQLQTPAHN